MNAETPGCIHEGGELGYALAVAYGSVFDSPDLITAVVVGGQLFLHPIFENFVADSMVWCVLDRRRK